MRSTPFFALSFCTWLSVALMPSSVLADPPAHIHVVKKGETLWNIAGQYLQNPTGWTQIQKLNALGTPKNLQVGTELNMPMLSSAFPAKVAHLQGQAWLVTPGKGERALTKGMTLDVGQSVRTGEASFVTVRFADGVNTVLPPLSLITLSKDQAQGTPQVLLQKGEVEAYVPKRSTPFNSFEVITPQGVLGVRGTHFRVLIDTPQSSLIEVLDGRVVANTAQTSNQPETSVTPNQGLVLNSKGALQVSNLLPATKGIVEAKTAPLDLAWQIRAQPVPAAAQYLAQISRSADFLSIEQHQRSPLPQFSFKGLNDAFYYVRIIAIDHKGLRGMPAEFLLLYRAANGDVVVRQEGLDTVFNWTAAPHAVDTRYRARVSSNTDLSAPLIDQRGIQSTAITIKDLPPGLLYWQVETDEPLQPSILGSGTLH